MLNIQTKKVIEVDDWNEFVKEFYGKPYNFQQQDGCKDRGVFHLEVPSKYTYDDDMNFGTM